MSSAWSQLFYIGPGYRWNWSKLPGENAFIQDYNAIRPWLDTEMEEINRLGGFGFSLGYGAGNIWLGYDYFGRKQDTYAEGLAPSTNTQVRRDLEIRNNVSNINVGVAAGEDGVGVCFGLQSSILNQRVKTRVFDVGDDPGEWEEPAGSWLNVSMGPALNLFFTGSAESPVAAHLHVAYTFGILSTNWGQLDEEINGTFYNYEDYPEKFETRPNYFSFGLGLAIFFVDM